MFGEERKGRWKEEKTKRLGIVTRLESRVNKDPAIRLFLEWKPLNLILTSFLIDLFSTIYERFFWDLLTLLMRANGRWKIILLFHHVIVNFHGKKYLPYYLGRYLGRSSLVPCWNVLVLTLKVMNHQSNDFIINIMSFHLRQQDFFHAENTIHEARLLNRLQKNDCRPIVLIKSNTFGSRINDLNIDLFFLALDAFPFHCESTHYGHHWQDQTNHKRLL